MTPIKKQPATLSHVTGCEGICSAQNQPHPNQRGHTTRTGS
jgi:hypothetical protein